MSYRDLPAGRREHVVERARQASQAVIGAACAAAGVDNPGDLDPDTYVRINDEATRAALAIAWWDGAHHRDAGIDLDSDLHGQYAMETLCMVSILALGLAPKGVVIDVADVERINDAGMEEWAIEQDSTGRRWRLKTRRR